MWALVGKLSRVGGIAACGAAVTLTASLSEGAVIPDLVHAESRFPLGVPQSDIIVHKKGYTVCYDFRTRNAKWVYEVLTPESRVTNASRAQVRSDSRLLVLQSFHIIKRL